MNGTRYVYLATHEGAPYFTGDSRFCCQYSSNLQLARRNNDSFSLIIPRTADIFLPDYFVFEMHNIDTIEEFKQTIKNTIFELVTDNYKVETNLSFFEELEGVQKIDNKFIVKLPLYFTTKEILHVACVNDTFIIRLKSVNESITNVTLFLQNKLLPSNLSRNMRVNTHRRIHFQVASHQLVPSNYSDKYLLPFEGLTTGYFIQTKISAIKRLEVMFADLPFLDFDSVGIHMYCKKISDNLLYVPLTNDLNFRSSDPSRYLVALSQRRLTDIHVLIEFDETQELPDSLNVHCLCFRHLLYSNDTVTDTAGLVVEEKDLDHTDLTVFNLPLYRQEDDDVPFEPQPVNAEINEEKEVKFEHDFSSWFTEHKLLNSSKNTECPISLEVIKENDEYSVCTTCSYNFDFNTLKSYLTTKREMKCPMCRAEWTGKFIYTNTAVGRDEENTESE